MVTCKAAEYISSPSGNLALLFYAEETDSHAAVAIVKSSDGETVWGIKKYGNNQGEGTDMKISKDGTSIIIGGQGGPPLTPTGALYGKLTSVSVVDGSHQWTKTFTVGGTPSLLFNECWGLALTADGGYTLACGAGIEDCGGFSGTLKSECDAGIG